MAEANEAIKPDYNETLGVNLVDFIQMSFSNNVIGHENAKRLATVIPEDTADDELLDTKRRLEASVDHRELMLGSGVVAAALRSGGDFEQDEEVVFRSDIPGSRWATGRVHSITEGGVHVVSDSITQFIIPPHYPGLFTLEDDAMLRRAPRKHGSPSLGHFIIKLSHFDSRISNTDFINGVSRRYHLKVNS